MIIRVWFITHGHRSITFTWATVAITDTLLPMAIRMAGAIRRGVTPMATMVIIHRGLARIIIAITGRAIEEIAHVMVVVAGIIMITGMAFITVLSGEIMKIDAAVMALNIRVKDQALRTGLLHHQGVHLPGLAPGQRPFHQDPAAVVPDRLDRPIAGIGTSATVIAGLMTIGIRGFPSK